MSSISHSTQAGVVFVHGLLGWPRIMQPLTVPFADQGCPVEILTLRGAEDHWAGVAPDAYRVWVADLKATIGRLRQTCDNVVAVGVFGGALLAAAVAAEGGVDALAMVCPPLVVPSHETFLRRRLGLIKTIVKMVRPSSGAIDAGSRYPVNGLSLDGDPWPGSDALQVNLSSMRLLAESALSRIRCPVLLMHSRHNALLPTENLEKTHRGLDAALAREVSWVSEPSQAYTPITANRTYLFAARHMSGLPLTQPDSDRPAFNAAIRGLQPRITRLIGRFSSDGRTGPCQAAAMVATEALLDQGYEALVVAAKPDAGPTGVPDHYWTEVHLGHEWLVVDFVPHGPMDADVRVCTRQESVRLGYEAGEALDLRLPSVRKRLVADIVALNVGMGHHLEG